MSMTGKHGEPWAYDDSGHVEDLFGPVLRVMSADDFPCLDEDDDAEVSLADVEARFEANARRAVACVNACDGLDDPAEWRRNYDQLLRGARLVYERAILNQNLGTAKQVLAYALKACGALDGEFHDTIVREHALARLSPSERAAMGV